MRWSMLALGLCATGMGCDVPPGSGSSSGWRRVEGDVALGVNFHTAWGAGQYVWAVGHRLGEFQDAIVQYDGASWSLYYRARLESVSAIWGIGADSLWIGGGRAITYWDGSHTSYFDIGRLLGIQIGR